MFKYKKSKYFIDIHRDSTTYNKSIIDIIGVRYAKVLFVIGKEHNNYKKNLELTNRINNKIVKKYPGLSKGVMVKSGPMVDGIYNKDVSPNSILIEIGGYQNNISEVQSSIVLFSEILKEEIIEKEK